MVEPCFFSRRGGILKKRGSGNFNLCKNTIWMNIFGCGLCMCNKDGWQLFRGHHNGLPMVHWSSESHAPKDRPPPAAKSSQRIGKWDSQRMVEEINLHSLLKLLHWQLLHFGPFGIRAYQVLYSRRQFNTHLEITVILKSQQWKMLYHLFCTF